MGWGVTHIVQGAIATWCVTNNSYKPTSTVRANVALTWLLKIFAVGLGCLRGNEALVGHASTHVLMAWHNLFVNPSSPIDQCLQVTLHCETCWLGICSLRTKRSANSAYSCWRGNHFIHEFLSVHTSYLKFGTRRCNLQRMIFHTLNVLWRSNG